MGATFGERTSHCAGSGLATHFYALLLPRLLAHRTISRFPKKWCTAFREPLQRTVTVVTLPIPRALHCDGPLVGSAIYRHTYRHREVPFFMRFFEQRDGRDACDGRLRAYSKEGALLYFVGFLTPST